MQISDLHDVYDGVFVEGELYIGVVYDNERKNYVFGQFFKKTLLKIYAEGQGFPFHLMSVYKHNIYQINLSYYYKYTSNELVLLNEADRAILYNLGTLINGKITKNKIISEPTTEKQKENDEHLITFGNDENFEKMENDKETASFLERDPCEEVNFVYFLDDGQPFEPLIESPKKSIETFNFTPKKNNFSKSSNFKENLKKEKFSLKKTNFLNKADKNNDLNSQKLKETLKKPNKTTKDNSNSSPCSSNETPQHNKEKTQDFGYEKMPHLLKSHEEKIKKKWNETERIIKKNRSLKKLDVIVDDSQFKNKFQELFNNFNDKQFLILEDEEPERGFVHDFSEEVFKKNHKIN